ncbi:MAG: RloB family protein [Bacteroidaceae bacterium]|nr:RloB family protein [Bacteroidaceae bacterium]
MADDCRVEHNFFLALSNPCFEIWLILHLKDLSEFNEKELKLLCENPRVSCKKHYVDTVIDESMDNGRGYNKRPNPRIFLPHTREAIERAKALSKNRELFPSGIGTDVYKLVEKLIK